MKSEATQSNELSPEVVEGIRKAHLAAFYANMRGILAQSLDKKAPICGLHGVTYTFDNAGVPRGGIFSAGCTPHLNQLLTGIGALQGHLTANYISRQVEDLKNSNSGDVFDPELGKPRCVKCNDGDLDGSHAREELEKNARAWLGVVVAIAQEFYGEFLSDNAKVALVALQVEALPADEQVS